MNLKEILLGAAITSAAAIGANSNTEACDRFDCHHKPQTQTVWEERTSVIRVPKVICEPKEITTYVPKMVWEERKSVVNVPRVICEDRQVKTYIPHRVCVEQPRTCTPATCTPATCTPQTCTPAYVAPSTCGPKKCAPKQCDWYPGKYIKEGFEKLCGNDKRVGHIDKKIDKLEDRRDKLLYQHHAPKTCRPETCTPAYAPACAEPACDPVYRSPAPGWRTMPAPTPAPGNYQPNVPLPPQPMPEPDNRPQGNLSGLSDRVTLYDSAWRASK